MFFIQVRFLTFFLICQINLLWLFFTKIELCDDFLEDLHPSAFKSGHGGKEGFSLFALFNHCRSVAGRKLLRQAYKVRRISLRVQNNWICFMICSCPVVSVIFHWWSISQSLGVETIPELNRGVPMASRRGQTLLAVFYSMRVLPMWLATVSTQGLCLVFLNLGFGSVALPETSQFCTAAIRPFDFSWTRTMMGWNGSWKTLSLDSKTLPYVNPLNCRYKV